MKELKIDTTIQIFSSEKELQKADRELLQKAKDNLHKAYAPYSNFLVSAALRLDNDVVLSGANMENASFPLALCAERTVLAAALSNFPHQIVTDMAITVKNNKKVINEPIAPCGACRQVLVENEDRFQHPIRLILQGESGDIYIIPSAKSLLPLSFNGSYL